MNYERNKLDQAQANQRNWQEKREKRESNDDKEKNHQVFDNKDKRCILLKIVPTQEKARDKLNQRKSKENKTKRRGGGGREE